MYYFTWGTLLYLNNSWQSPLVYWRTEGHGGFAAGRVRHTEDLPSDVGGVHVLSTRIWSGPVPYLRDGWVTTGSEMLQKVPRAGWASCQEQISSEGEYVAVVKRMFSVEKPFSLTLSTSASRSSCVVFFKWHECFKLGHRQGGSSCWPPFPPGFWGVCAGRSLASAPSCYFQCLW